MFFLLYIEIKDLLFFTLSFKIRIQEETLMSAGENSKNDNNGLSFLFVISVRAVLFSSTIISFILQDILIPIPYKSCYVNSNNIT